MIIKQINLSKYLLLNRDFFEKIVDPNYGFKLFDKKFTFMGFVNMFLIVLLVVLFFVISPDSMVVTLEQKMSTYNVLLFFVFLPFSIIRFFLIKRFESNNLDKIKNWIDANINSYKHWDELDKRIIYENKESRQYLTGKLEENIFLIK